MLAQKQENWKVHYVLYASRIMNCAQRICSACEGDALAVVVALRQFRVYHLSSYLFRLITYQQAFSFAFRKKDNHGRLARCNDFLAEYESRVEYRREKANGAADYLYRVQVNDSVIDYEIALALHVTAYDLNNLEPQLQYVTTYLQDMSAKGVLQAQRAKVKSSAKYFLLWEGIVLHRPMQCPRLAASVSSRRGIPNAFQDDIEHRDVRSAKQLVLKKYCWPNALKNVFGYVQSCTRILEDLLSRTVPNNSTFTYHESV